MNARWKSRTTKAATVVALLGMVLMSSGFVLMAGVGPAAAAPAGTCTPRAAYTETTGWVDGSPGAGWRQVDEKVTPGTPAVPEIRRYEWQRTVLDQPGTAAVTKDWGDTRYSYNPKGGPQNPPQGSTPASDPEHWQGNTSNYNGTDPLGVAWVEGNGQSASWFFWSVKRVVVKPATDPTYKTVFEWGVDSPGEGWTKTGESEVVQQGMPGTPETKQYKYAFDHAAVTCAVEATVTIDPPSCDNGGVGSWSLGGEHMDFAPASSGTGGPGQVEVEATAGEGYVFDTGTSKKTYTVDLPEYFAPDGFEIDPESGACVAVEGPRTVTPGEVSFSADCDPFAVTLPGGTVVTDPGTTEVDGVEYAVTGDFEPGGTVEVKAGPAGDAVFPDPAPQTEWSHTFASEEECTQVEPPQIVVPGEVSFSEDCEPFAVTLPGGTVVTEPGTTEVDGVEYAVTGDFEPGGTVDVTASPAGDAVFPDPTPQTEWSHTFAPEEECTQVSPPVVDPPTDGPDAPSNPAGPTGGTATSGTTGGGTTRATTTGVAAVAGTAPQGVTVPSVVHAGIRGPSSPSSPAPAGDGLALALSGLLLLIAGGAGMVRKHGVRTR